MLFAVTLMRMDVPCQCPKAISSDGDLANTPRIITYIDIIPLDMIGNIHDMFTKTRTYYGLYIWMSLD